jgi:hypothetical protein
MTYFVKGYGYYENGTSNDFSIVFDLAEISSKNFIKAVEETAGLSPFRRNKKIIIENVVKL